METVDAILHHECHTNNINDDSTEIQRAIVLANICFPGGGKYYSKTETKLCNTVLFPAVFSDVEEEWLTKKMNKFWKDSCKINGHI